MNAVAPDRPGDLSFIVKTPSSVLVSWTRPSPRSNGVIILYELSYYQDIHVDGETLHHNLHLWFLIIFQVDWIEQGLTSYIIGHIGMGFYGSNDPTNSVKALKEDRF